MTIWSVSFFPFLWSPIGQSNEWGKPIGPFWTFGGCQDKTTPTHPTHLIPEKKQSCSTGIDKSNFERTTFELCVFLFSCMWVEGINTRTYCRDSGIWVAVYFARPRGNCGQKKAKTRGTELIHFVISNGEWRRDAPITK